MLSGRALAQSTSADRVLELERVVQQLERRVSELEAQLAKPEAVANARAGALGDASDIQNWRQLRRGMKEADVERLLGVADKVDVYSSWSVWSFRAGGEVRFGSSARLEAWSEP
jgi:hypothetical protein